MKFTIAVLLLSLSLKGKEIRGQIFNGEAAVRGEFKYAAFLYSRTTFYTTEVTACGGAIIAPNWILTAAHCVYRKVEALIYLGSLDRENPEVQYKIKQFRFHIHSEFNPVHKWNDIALVNIPKTVKCDGIAYAPLPDADTDPQPGDMAIIMGWGHIGDDDVIPENLLWAEVKLITKEECRREFQYILDSELCASTKPPCGSTCAGDSGGPLVLRDSGKLIGIATCGGSSCTNGKPITFTRVQSYMWWITRITGIIL